MPKTFPGIVKNNEQIKAFTDFKKAVNKEIEVRHGSDLEPELLTLRDEFEHFDQLKNSSEDRQQALNILERKLLTGLPAMILILRNG